MAATRVLVVAHKTAATPALIEAVRERAAKGPATFTLLVPNVVGGLTRAMDPEDAPEDAARDMLALAVPLLEQAAGGKVEGKVGDANPMNAVQDAINIDGYDEIIISTLPSHVSRWLHLDLPRKVAALGLPVTTITAGAGARAAAEPA